MPPSHVFGLKAKRGPKGMRNRERYQPYKNEKNWFKLKRPRTANAPIADFTSETHPVFLMARIAAYKAPRTVDCAWDG